MVRLTNETANLCKMVLIWCSTRGLTMRDIWRDVVGRYNDGRLDRDEDNESIANFLSSIDGSFDPRNVSLNDIRDSIKPMDKNADGEIIETIVEVLTRPNARNILSGGTLESLRRAILNPDEMSEVRQRVRRREMCCGVCGRPFQSNDICTIRQEVGGSDSHLCLTCSTCAQPRYVPCGYSGCANHLPIPEKVLKVLNGVFGKYCPDHQPKRAGEPVSTNDIVRSEAERSWSRRVWAPPVRPTPTVRPQIFNVRETDPIPALDMGFFDPPDEERDE